MTPEERARQEVLLAARKIGSGEWALTPGVWRRAEVELKAEARPPEDRLLAVLKDVKAALLRALEAGPPPDVRRWLDAALAAIAGVEPGAEVGAKSSTPRAAIRALEEKMDIQDQRLRRQEELVAAVNVGASLPRGEDLAKAQAQVQAERANRMVDHVARETRDYLTRETDEDNPERRALRKLRDEARKAKLG